jgi:hypothetical protein
LKLRSRSEVLGATKKNRSGRGLHRRRTALLGKRLTYYCIVSLETERNGFEKMRGAKSSYRKRRHQRRARQAQDFDPEFYRHPTKRKNKPVNLADEGGCKGKRRFPNIEAAHAAGDFMARLQNNPDVYMYKCECCGGYHLTKMQFAPDLSANRWVYNFGEVTDA